MSPALREAVAVEAFLELAERGCGIMDLRRMQSLIRNGSTTTLRAARLVEWEDGCISVVAEGTHVPKRPGVEIRHQEELLTFARRIGREVVNGRARKGGIKV